MPNYKLIRANVTVVSDLTAHEYVRDIRYKGHFIRCTVDHDWIVTYTETAYFKNEWTSVHSGLIDAYEYIDRLEQVTFGE